MLNNKCIILFHKSFSLFFSSQSRFNASAAPFVSQQQRSSVTSANTATAPGAVMTPKETSTPSAALQARQMPIPVHMSAASPHHYGGYETPLTGRSGGMTRGVFNTRYPVAPPPSPIYGFENDMCRMVSEIFETFMVEHRTEGIYMCVLSLLFTKFLMRITVNTRPEYVQKSLRAPIVR